MRFLVLAALTASAAALAMAFPSGARAEEGPVISGPFSHDNLSIYFIHGKSAPGPAPLTLQEALAKESVRVAETGSVNELKIENLGDEDVYIQSGDIVKGGRQDRVLTASFILPKKSGSRAHRVLLRGAWPLEQTRRRGRKQVCEAPPTPFHRARRNSP